MNRALPPMNPWRWSQTLGETFAAGLDPQGLGRLQRERRLRALLAAAHEASPFYRERLGAPRGGAPALASLAPVDKAELMHHFDDWATDRRITRAGVDDFLAATARIGDAYLDRYLVWTSSGTSGEPGIFVQDEAALAAFDALDLLRFRGLGLGAMPAAVFAPGQRYAYVAATGGHFAGIASIERLRRIGDSAALLAPWLRPQVRTFSVLQPLSELMRELQDYAPTVMISYPSCADLLAQAAAAGRLALKLQEVWVGGEQLSTEQRQRIVKTFGCRLRNNYGASEFFSIAWECAHGAMHLNDDWMIAEPVDRDDRPVPVGEASHALLLTNLANHTQPLLRYRLSDSLRVLPGRCACGSSFTCIEIQGRADETLALCDTVGREVRLLPLALMTVIEEGAQLTQFQLLATSPQCLDLRLEKDVVDADAAFERARGALLVFLQQQGLGNVQVQRCFAALQAHPRSGKLSRVLTA